MNIAFWNVNKNTEIDIMLEKLVFENNIDILILAEYNGTVEKLCENVNKRTKQFKLLQSQIGCDKIKGLVNSRYNQEPLCAVTRYSVVALKTSYFKLILGLIHGESNLHANDYDRQATFARFYKDLEDSENKLQTNNSIIIGDLNSNPFDVSVMHAGSLHAIPYKEEVSNPTRIVSDIEYKKFYNPSWKFLNSEIPPYGTYYYNNSKSINYYWNTFDQVIMRPSLVSAFNNESLKIITKINNESLLKDNYKPNTKYSDHLPISFQIKEDKIK